MTRRITITVINTGVAEQWNLSSNFLEHGKWMVGSPPNSILQYSTAEIKSEKTSGSLYGTTGQIVFISTVKRGTTLTINWNKPYGTDPTTCTANINGVAYLAAVRNTLYTDSEAK